MSTDSPSILIKLIKDPVTIFTSWDNFIGWLFINPMFITTSLAAFVAISVAKYNKNNTINQDRIKASIEFEKNYQHGNNTLEWKKDTGTIFRKFLAEKDNCIRCQIMNPKTREEKEQFQSLSLLLNEWERCSNGIISKIYNENLLYGTYSVTLIDLFEHSILFIINRQKVNPRLYIRVTKLALKWKLRQEAENHIADKTLRKEKKKDLLILKKAFYLLQRHNKIVYGEGIRSFITKNLFYSFEETKNPNLLLVEVHQHLIEYYHLNPGSTFSSKGICLQEYSASNDV